MLAQPYRPYPFASSRLVPVISESIPLCMYGLALEIILAKYHDSYCKPLRTTNMRRVYDGSYGLHSYVHRPSLCTVHLSAAAEGKEGEAGSPGSRNQNTEERLVSGLSASSSVLEEARRSLD